ncbi:MAG TPA: urease accessory UreF family protein [Caldimonas sp.]|nr:urease accessory UreF family protein [Caldimonas sp.]
MHEPPLSAHGLLQILWLASPALPIGGFSYSEGLEAAIDAGRVRDEAQAADWLVDQLHLVFARSDLAAVSAAHGAWAAHDLDSAADLNAWVHATRESAELRGQTEQMGRSLAAWLAARAPDDARVAALAAFAPAPTWPLAAALAAACSGAPRREALLALAFGWAENLVQAAVKAMPLGQAAGQRVLARLVDAMPQAVDAAIALPREARQAYAPMLAILCARHETQYSRLFRS